MKTKSLTDSLRKGHPILGPDDVDKGAADIIEALIALLQKARDFIGSMPTTGVNGSDRFLETAKLVSEIEAVEGIEAH